MALALSNQRIAKQTCFTFISVLQHVSVSILISSFHVSLFLSNTMWRFPKIGVPPNHRLSIRNQPSSHWISPHDYGNLHAFLRTTKSSILARFSDFPFKTIYFLGYPQRNPHVSPPQKQKKKTSVSLQGTPWANGAASARGCWRWWRRTSLEKP